MRSLWLSLPLLALYLLWPLAAKAEDGATPKTDIPTPAATHATMAQPLKSRLGCPENTVCDLTLLSGFRWTPSENCTRPSVTAATPALTAQTRAEKIVAYNQQALAAQDFARCVNEESRAFLRYFQERIALIVQGGALAQLAPLEQELKAAHLALQDTPAPAAEKAETN